MAKKAFSLVGIEGAAECSGAFLRGFHTALLLSLVERGFLTQAQFCQCGEELGKRERR